MTTKVRIEFIFSSIIGLSDPAIAVVLAALQASIYSMIVPAIIVAFFTFLSVVRAGSSDLELVWNSTNRVSSLFSSYISGLAIYNTGNNGTNTYVAGVLNANSERSDYYKGRFFKDGRRRGVFTYGGGSTRQWCYAVAVDADVNVYSTGVMYTGHDGQPYAGGGDIAVFKYSVTEAAKKWLRLFGTAAYEQGSGIVLDTTGSAYVTGYSSGNLDGITNAGGTDIFLAKYNTNGVQQWVRMFGSSANDRGTGVAIAGNGRLYVTGYIGAQVSGSSYFGSDDFILAEYSAEGNLLDLMVFGSSASDRGNGIAALGTIVYVIGTTFGSLSSAGNAGGADVFVFNFDVSIRESRFDTLMLGSSGDDHGTALFVTSNNVYITGSTTGNFDGQQNNAIQSIFVSKIAVMFGTRTWSWLFSDFDAQAAYGIGVDAAGNVLVGGHFNSSQSIQTGIMLNLRQANPGVDGNGGGGSGGGGGRNTVGPGVIAGSVAAGALVSVAVVGYIVVKSCDGKKVIPVYKYEFAG